MTTPIQQKKISPFLAGLEHRKQTKNGGKSSFNEAIRQRTAGLGSLPHFPHHKARPQNISVGQAQKLARHAPHIQEAARKYNVPVELICGVILQESGGNARAVSPAGARGLMQLMPQTARRFGVTNSFDPKYNIDGGTRYLRWLLDHFNGNVELTLAGYNAGERNVAKHGYRVPPFRETQNYVPNVLGYALAMVQMLKAGQTQAQIKLPSNAKMA